VSNSCILDYWQDKSIAHQAFRWNAFFIFFVYKPAVPLERIFIFLRIASVSRSDNRFVANYRFNHVPSGTSGEQFMHPGLLARQINCTPSVALERIFYFFVYKPDVPLEDNTLSFMTRPEKS